MNILNRLYYYYSKFVKKILIGKCIYHSTIHKTASVNSGCSIYNSVIGKCSYLGYDCEVIDAEIGSFCSLASGIHIGLAEHPTEWVSTSPVFQNVNSSIKKKYAELLLPKDKSTIIGNDVWIGTNAIIKKGVYIGDGAVIGSGAVVTKDIPPYSIVGGCPAKIIRYRFNDNIVERLIKSKWWNLSEIELEKYGIYVNDPELFLDKIEGINELS